MVFENLQLGHIRAVAIEGEPWFVAKDVCVSLDVKDTWNAMQRLPSAMKGTDNISTLGGMQEMTIINEAGLYKLAFTSRKPEAEKFTDWVATEVIPNIRKRGAYMTPATIEEVLNNPDFIIGLATRLKESQTLIQAQDKHIAALEPKAEFYDAVAGSRDAISISDAAKVLGIKNLGQNKLFKILREKKILDRENKPYQEYIDRGYFRMIEQKFTKHGETNIYIKTLVYQRGLDYIRKTVGVKE